MRASFEKIIYQNASYYVNRHDKKFFDHPFHFHPEIEITIILEGHGQRLVGDSINEFEPGDLILLGDTLPHYWKSDKVYHQPNHLRCRSYYIQFRWDAFGEGFFDLPEFAEIRNLLLKAQKGIRFLDNEKCLKVYKPYFEKIFTQNSHLGFTTFIWFLGELAKSNEIILLSNKDKWNYLNQDDIQRIQLVVDYINENLDKRIALSEVADLLHMTNSSFSRYFKQKTKKSPFEYIIELRLTKAKKLLRETSLPIIQVCYESGFNNLSNFNRIFKKNEAISPLNYRKLMTKE